MNYSKARAHPAIRWFEKLLDIPSPPAHERAMGELIMAEVRGMGYACEPDALGTQTLCFRV